MKSTRPFHRDRASRIASAHLSPGYASRGMRAAIVRGLDHPISFLRPNEPPSNPIWVRKIYPARVESYDLLKRLSASVAVGAALAAASSRE